MLIIAIPKSASTSLLSTIGYLHDIKAIQDFSFSANSKPENCNILFNYHSDIRELDKLQVDNFSKKDIVNKQHIYPSDNNVNLLKNVKKVILFRDPHDIIYAYKRGALKKVHNLLNGYSNDMTDEEWINKSKRDGLYPDLEFFIKNWRNNADPKNTLFIEYNEYLNNTKETINRIEKFYGLPITSTDVSPIKARYSRHSNYDKLVINTMNKSKAIVIRLLEMLNLKTWVKNRLKNKS